MRELKSPLDILKHSLIVNKIFLQHFGLLAWILYPRVWFHDWDKLLNMLFKKTYDRKIHRSSSRHHPEWQLHNRYSVLNIKEAICDWESVRYKGDKSRQKRAIKYFYDIGRSKIYKAKKTDWTTKVDLITLYKVQLAKGGFKWK